MIDKLKKLFGVGSLSPEVPQTEVKTEKAVKKPRKVKPPKVELTEKERATLAGEPWVGILGMDIDPQNINAGSFTLDWNDKFILNLIKTGYKQKEDDTDQLVVDRWFQTVCKNIALEVYEQQAADPVNRELEELRRIHSRDIGNGRSEVS